MHCVVICKDEGRWYLTTRRVFLSEAEAATYAATVHPARDASIVRVSDLVGMLPKGVELTPPWVRPDCAHCGHVWSKHYERGVPSRCTDCDGCEYYRSN